MKAKEYVSIYGPRIMVGGPDATEAILEMAEALLQEMIDINAARYKSNMVHDSVLMEIVDKWDAIAARINKPGEPEIVSKNLLRDSKALAPYIEKHKNAQVLQRLKHIAQSYGPGSDKYSDIQNQALEYLRALPPRSKA